MYLGMYARMFIRSSDCKICVAWLTETGTVVLVVIAFSIRACPMLRDMHLSVLVRSRITLSGARDSSGRRTPREPSNGLAIRGPYAYSAGGGSLAGTMPL